MFISLFSFVVFRLLFSMDIGIFLICIMDEGMESNVRIKILNIPD